MKPFFLYILRCSDGCYYVGHTDDLEARIAQHQDGSLGGYTASRRPVELVFSAELDSRDEALQREMQVKGWSRAKKEALIRGDWSALPELSRSRSGPAPRSCFDRLSTSGSGGDTSGTGPRSCFDRLSTSGSGSSASGSSVPLTLSLSKGERGGRDA